MHENNPEASLRVSDAGSFRDPSGFIFVKDGVLYRQVNHVYARAYDLLMQSGLYEDLVRRGHMVSHEEVNAEDASSDAYKIIRPERIPFISYPYEWCFSELKDAAILTLKIQKIALRYGMILKDASAYNIQFTNGHPILIDTLSFEQYQEGAPWVAYRQFCKHFMAPLALMSYVDIRLNGLLRTYIDGIPLDFASKLLPWRSWFRAATFFHIHLHAKSEHRYATKEAKSPRASVSRTAFTHIVQSLKAGVSAFAWEPQAAETPYDFLEDDHSAAEFPEKMREAKRFLETIHPQLVWNLGTGHDRENIFTGNKRTETVFFDKDYAVVEKNYLAVRDKKTQNVLPFVMDFANPSPAIGWASEERVSLIARGPADLVSAFDVIHEFAIGNNVPFPMLAEFFAKISRALIIEFIPKNDAVVMRLLRNRGDIFDWYTKENFEGAFARHFRIVGSYELPRSKRTIYLMQKIYMHG